MARFTVSQRNQYITDQYNAQWNSGASKTIAQVRSSAASIHIEADRHLPNISECTGTMYLQGSAGNYIDMVLLEEGEVGGIVLDGVETGYQLVPIVTGNDTSPNWPAAAGITIESTPFDGVSEVRAGSGATENMLFIDYPGYFDVVSSAKPSPQGAQANREVETDLFVFNAAGQAIRDIGFVASANQSTGGRAFTQNTPRVNLNPNFLGQGEYIGLVIRKFTNEAPTTVRLSKAFVQVTLTSLGQ